MPRRINKRCAANDALEFVRFNKKANLPGKAIVGHGRVHYSGEPVWIECVATLASDVNGIFTPAVKRGMYVQKGALVGRVTDYLGRPLIDARAPESGVVLFIRAVPSMTKGETIANIGVPAR